MAKLLKLRRGTTTQHGSFTGAEGEVTVDTDKETLVVHDGSTAGGHPVAAEDMANVSSASIAGRLGTDSIATSKIAAGALPTDVTVASANIVNGTIVNADIASNAAIAGTKLENSGVTAGSYGSSSAIPILTVDAQGLVTGASTTAVDSTKIQNGTTEVATASSGDITMKRSGTTRLVVDNAGVDVTGNINATGNIEISSAAPSLYFTEGDANPDYQLLVNSGNFRIYDVTNTTNRLVINTDGHVDVPGNLDVGNGLDVTGNTAVTGNITCSGTVKGRDVSADGTLLDGLTSSSGVLTDGVTATTQAQSDSSSKVSTTSYVRTAIQNAQAFPSGTKMLFQQTAAPTGWTKVTSGVDNKSIRVVSGTVGSGGSNAFSNTFTNKSITANAANATQGGNITVSDTSAGGNVSIDSATTGGTVDSHTLTTNQMPSHVHYMYTNQYHQQSNRYANSAGFYPGYNGQQTRENAGNSRRQTYNSGYGESVGGDGGHSHGFSGSSHNHNGTLSGTAHNHNASFSGSAHNHNANASFSGSAHNHNANASFTGSAHNHSISVGNLDMSVQYVDVIIATKN